MSYQINLHFHVSAFFGVLFLLPYVAYLLDYKKIVFKFRNTLMDVHIVQLTSKFYFIIPQLILLTAYKTTTFVGTAETRYTENKTIIRLVLPIVDS